MQDRIGTYYVICEGSETGQIGGGARMHFQDVPDVFVGAFEGTKTDTDPQEPLTAPGLARLYEHAANALRFAAVDGHRQLFTWNILCLSLFQLLGYFPVFYKF